MNRRNNLNYFVSIFILYIHISILSATITWGKACQELLLLREKLLKSPREMRTLYCNQQKKVSPEDAHSLKPFVGVDCDTQILWRNTLHAWSYICDPPSHKRHVFSPRYYHIHFTCNFQIYDMKLTKETSLNWLLFR